MSELTIADKDSWDDPCHAQINVEGHAVCATVVVAMEEGDGEKPSPYPDGEQRLKDIVHRYNDYERLAFEHEAVLNANKLLVAANASLCAAQPQQRTILDAARAAVDAGGQKYGGQMEGFVLTARYWSALFGIPIGHEQVVLAFILNKLSRETMSHNADNLVDIAGYAQVLAQLREESAARVDFVQRAQRIMSDSDLRGAALLGSGFERRAAEQEIISRFISRAEEGEKR